MRADVGQSRIFDLKGYGFSACGKTVSCDQKNGASAAKAGCISRAYGTAEAVPLQIRGRKLSLFRKLFSCAVCLLKIYPGLQPLELPPTFQRYSLAPPNFLIT